MGVKSLVLLVTVAVLVSVLATVGGLLYRQTLRYMDFESDRFGFPYYWIEHVGVTLAGRTDLWNIELWNFAMNVILFFAVSCVTLCLAFVWKSKRSRFSVSQRNWLG